MSLKKQLTDDLKEAMKSKDQVKKSTITLIRADIKQQEVDNRIELKDEDIIKIISKQLKQRKDSLEDFKRGGRDDLVKQTEEEMNVLLSYLPEQLDDENLTEIVKNTIDEVGATSMKDMGKVMPKIMSKVKGQADGKKINQIVTKFLK